MYCVRDLIVWWRCRHQTTMTVVCAQLLVERAYGYCATKHDCALLFLFVLIDHWFDCDCLLCCASLQDVAALQRLVSASIAALRNAAAAGTSSSSSGESATGSAASSAPPTQPHSSSVAAAVGRAAAPPPLPYYTSGAYANNSEPQNGAIGGYPPTNASKSGSFRVL